MIMLLENLILFGSVKNDPDSGSSTKKSGNSVDTNSGTIKNVKTADDEESNEKEEVVTTK